MKFSTNYKRISSLMLLFVFPISVFSQQAEIKVQYRIGVPINNFKKLDLPQDNNGFYYNNSRSIKPILDQGWKLNFKYKLSKRYLLFLNLNFEKSFSKDYLHIFVPQPIDNVILKQSRNVVGLGLKKQFRIYNDIFRIELGAELTLRNSSFDQTTYSTELAKTDYDWMKYSYEINIYDKRPSDFPLALGYQKKTVNGNYNLSFLFPVKSNFIINLDFEYTGGLIYYYSFNYTSFIYTDNSTIPTTINNFENPINYMKKNNLYASIGLSYKFRIENKKLK